jgi:hypothetical protein
MAQQGRIPPAKSQEWVIDLGEKQRALVGLIQRDEGYLATLQKEIEAVKERLAANRGQLDLIAELAQEYIQPGVLEEALALVPRGGAPAPAV